MTEGNRWVTFTADSVITKKNPIPASWQAVYSNAMLNEHKIVFPVF